MEATYKWELKQVLGKPIFTDKNGNIRENVLKVVHLEYVGTLDDKVEKVPLIVHFNVTDLSSFTDYSQLSKEDVIQMALSVRHPKEIEALENEAKQKLEKNSFDNSFVTFEFE